MKPKLKAHYDKINANPDFLNNLIKGYNAGKIVAIVALCIPVIGWFYISIAASVLIGIQEIRSKRIGHGVCLIIFGWLTFGFWPLATAFLRKDELRKIQMQQQARIDGSMKPDAAETFYNIEFNKSLLKGNKVGKLISLIGLCIPIIGWLYIVPVGCVITSIQLIRVKKTGEGVAMLLFGDLTLGIWPFIAAKNNAKKNIKYIEANEQKIANKF